MKARASPWWVFAFAVCGARARRRGRGEEPRSMYFALHDLYNQTIDVWLLAGYPHSGAGWVRNLWDVSLGIASESVHQVEGDTWNRRSGSWGTRCGSRPPPDARSAAAKRCEKLCGFQSFNPTSMCAYSNDLDRTLCCLLYTSDAADE